jgi:hypothetical protein
MEIDQSKSLHELQSVQTSTDLTVSLKKQGKALKAFGGPSVFANEGDQKPQELSPVTSNKAANRH